ncbi:hypothetical protein CDAR_394231 [Caerostris darwini]|uniref:Uncharacterized protein n=1 Tax=Caerostris darwini TaxID=1538125 RepID=A0AAV4RIK4_9ARAC|nr:hypothetical protein CDAR_394231 [Caerostris darwini]
MMDTPTSVLVDVAAPAEIFDHTCEPWRGDIALSLCAIFRHHCSGIASPTNKKSALFATTHVHVVAKENSYSHGSGGYVKDI